MNGLHLLLIVSCAFYLTYHFYGRLISKQFGVDPSIPCPSHTKRDDIDYVPTSPYILFGHHFASIAGAGPIIGPIIVCEFGWGGAVLWVLLGCIFIGTVHDFSAMFLSVRNEGRSIAYIIEKELGYLGRQLFLLFCLGTLIVVVAVFTVLVAKSFVQTPAVATSSILFILMTPLFALLTRARILSLLQATFIFVPLLFACIWIGEQFPMNYEIFCDSAECAENFWRIGLLCYAIVASILPVWFLLQPRDYLNSYILLVMIAAAVIGIVIGQPTISLPFFINPQEAYGITDKLRIFPDFIPLLFVTVACGACSGFHALVASGTSSKQVDNEKHIRPVAMGAMYVEGILAILAVISVGYLSHAEFHAQYISSNFQPQKMFADGIANFIARFGIAKNTASIFIELSISAFILTTLDTTMRLARFIWQEILLPSDRALTTVPSASKPTAKLLNSTRDFFTNRWIATFAVAALAMVLMSGNTISSLWSVFGSVNQLLAGITLMVVTLWLFRTRRKTVFVALPAIFMFTTSIWALSYIIVSSWQVADKRYLAIIGATLLALVCFLIVLGVRRIIKDLKSRV